ncbi:MAG: PxKF domain-containing protein [Gemmatimonadota bacterium]|nr:PxKF domain-containing protein [Gemmatimonadota bacterium]
MSAAQNSGFRFDTANGHYTYDWKTDKGWKGTCRQLVLRFADGTERVLRFEFT